MPPLPPSLDSFFGRKLFPALPKKNWRGVWWDVAEEHTLEHADAYVRRMKRFGINECCIQLNYNTVPEVFRSSMYSVKTLLRFASKLRKAGIAVSLGPWCRPTKRYVDSVVGSDELQQLVKSRLFWAIEYDAEEPWIRTDVEGFANRDAAGKALIAATREALPHWMHVGVNAPPEYLKHVGELARRADHVCVQAYSFANENPETGNVHPAHLPGAMYGPGNMQQLAAKRVAALKGPALAMGLATTRQAFPAANGHPALTELQGIVIAYDAAVKQSPVGVRWWSGRAFLTNSAETKHPERAKFFLTRAQDGWA